MDRGCWVSNASVGVGRAAGQASRASSGRSAGEGRRRGRALHRERRERGRGRGRGRGCGRGAARASGRWRAALRAACCVAGVVGCALGKGACAASRALLVKPVQTTVLRHRDGRAGARKRRRAAQRPRWAKGRGGAAVMGSRRGCRRAVVQACRALRAGGGRRGDGQSMRCESSLAAGVWARQASTAALASTGGQLAGGRREPAAATESSSSAGAGGASLATGATGAVVLGADDAARLLLLGEGSPARPPPTAYRPRPTAHRPPPTTVAALRARAAIGRPALGDSDCAPCSRCRGALRLEPGAWSLEPGGPHSRPRFAPLAAANWALGAAGHLTWPWPWPSTLALTLLAASAEQPACLEPRLTAPSRAWCHRRSSESDHPALSAAAGETLRSCPGPAAAKHSCDFCIVRLVERPGPPHLALACI